MARQKIIVFIGNSSFVRVCIENITAIKDCRTAGIIFTDHNNCSTAWREKIFLLKDIPELTKKKYCFCLAFDQPSEMDIKKRLFFQIKSLKAELPVWVSSHAYVSSHAILGEGTIILAGAIVNAGAKIGKNCLVSTGALIEHDAVIGDHSYIGCSSVVNGGVEVKENCYLGSKNITRQYIKIAEGTKTDEGFLFKE